MFRRHMLFSLSFWLNKYDFILILIEITKMYQIT